MSRRTVQVRHLVVAGCLIGLGLGEHRTYAQWVTSPAWTTFVPAAAVSFTISTERDTYSAHERVITLQYRIGNISNHTFYVPRAPLEGCPTVTLHIWAWLEDGLGRRSGSGVAASCISGLDSRSPTVTERMDRAAVLLKPGEHVDGTTPLFVEQFPPGAYRIEAILSGWKSDSFSEAERAELAHFGNPFLSGEIPASVRVTLTP